jgi:hypothetical protein
MRPLTGIEAWLEPKTDEEMDQIEKNWVKTAVECGDIVWLDKFGYNKDGNKKKDSK